MSKIPNFYDRVDLLRYATNGLHQYHTTVGIPPYRLPPDVLEFEGRFYQRTSRQPAANTRFTYVECFVCRVYPEHEQVEIQPPTAASVNPSRGA